MDGEGASIFSQRAVIAMGKQSSQLANAEESTRVTCTATQTIRRMCQWLDHSFCILNIFYETCCVVGNPAAEAGCCKTQEVAAASVFPSNHQRCNRNRLSAPVQPHGCPILKGVPLFRLSENRCWNNRNVWAGCTYIAAKNTLHRSQRTEITTVQVRPRPKSLNLN